jgi:hypothetical protein
MKKYILLVPFLAILFMSCEDVVPVKLGDKNVDLFMVEAKITTIDEPFVFLAKTLPVNVDKPMEGISGAVVTISDNAQPSNILTLVEDTLIQKGYYVVPENIDYYGIAGREYTITIEIDGETLQAKDYLAPVEPIDSIKVGASDMADKYFLSVYAYSQETPGLGNYYKWDVFVNDTLLNEAASLAVANDELVDGNYVSGLEVFVDFYDPKKKEDRKLNIGDTISLRQNSISSFAYDYYMQMLTQSQSGSLFSPNPANIKGNFTTTDGKDVQGMFTAQDVSLSNIVVIDQNMEDQLK